MMTTDKLYPCVEADKRGWRVRTGPGAFLPGIYLNYLQAQKGLLRYLGKIAENQKTRRAKDK
jgi:hypothetical protein